METIKKKIAIVQARMGSTRFPGKVLADISGKPALWHLCENLRHSRLLTTIILATTTNSEDDALSDFAQSNGVTCFRGSENDVLERFHGAALSVDAKDEDIIVRVTADDIFMDPRVIDALIVLYESMYPSYKFLSNSFTTGFPYGQYYELFDVSSLKYAHAHATTDEEKEHVTPYMRQNRDTFPAIAVASQGGDFSDVHLSIDTADDLERNRLIIERLEAEGKEHPYSWQDVVEAYRLLGLTQSHV